MEDEWIEESSVRLLGSSVGGDSGGGRGGGGGGESFRWVDGSEVDSESPPWSFNGDEEIREGFGSVRRRLIKRPKRVDSFDVEAMEIAGSHGHHNKDASMWRTASLAFQTLGVVYGDMGTSPLYVFSDVFSKVPITSDVDVLGTLSLVIYTIALIPLIKYVFVVLKANDNGEGGTFALYSLICRYANVNLLPNRQAADECISSFKLKLPTPELERALNIKETLEHNFRLKIVLLLLVLMGTSMIIGDGILTPAISVMSAVSGLQGRIPGFGTDALVITSIIILLGLFSIQRFGTSKVGFSFAPALALWFFSLAAIGIYNLLKYDVTVVKAVNPVYIYLFFKKNGITGWSALGGCVLCITGAEAMFADLGHFNVPAIQISFSGIVFPSLLLAYTGQAAYLSKFPNNVKNTFYDSIPGPLYWPTFVVANAAAIIASQAMISGAFAIISQSLSLSCFPRVKVVHTSAKYEGQVYIPEINYFLMVACVIVTYGFKTTEKIGNAYGIAVVAVMLITTCLVTLIMLMIWKTKIWWILLFFVVFMSVEMIYFSSVLYKFTQGGYLPLALSLVFMTMMGMWHYAQRERYIFELNNKASSAYVRDLSENQDIKRIPGIGLIYSELVQGIPPIFSHFISNVPSIHSVVLFVSIKSIPISKVALEERFLFRQVEPKEYKIFRCVVRYGYKDAIEEPKEFERQLMDNLVEFIRHEHFIREGGTFEQIQEPDNVSHSGLLTDGKARNSSSSVIHVEESLDHQAHRVSTGSCGGIRSTNSSNRITRAPVGSGAEEEMEFVKKAHDQGVFYLIGEAEVVAKQDSSLVKKFIINYAYSFLRKNFRQGEKVLAIPRTRLLRVGMTYEV